MPTVAKKNDSTKPGLQTSHTDSIDTLEKIAGTYKGEMIFWYEKYNDTPNPEIPVKSRYAKEGIFKVEKLGSDSLLFTFPDTFSNYVWISKPNQVRLKYSVDRRYLLSYGGRGENSNAISIDYSVEDSLKVGSGGHRKKSSYGAVEYFGNAFSGKKIE